MNATVAYDKFEEHNMCCFWKKYTTISTKELYNTVIERYKNLQFWQKYVPY